MPAPDIESYNFTTSVSLVALDTRKAGKRIFCRACLDWSERRYHVAGFVGAEICGRMFALGWVTQQRGTRAIQVTPAGHRGLQRLFAIDLGHTAPRLAG